MLTGAAAVGVSKMTDGAAAVIPEILAGQILSLARRGRGGHTILAASGSGGVGETACDRLVVLLGPILADGDDDSSERDVRGNDSGGRRAGYGVEGADERPRHALVVSCAPRQVRCLL